MSARAGVRAYTRVGLYIAHACPVLSNTIQTPYTTLTRTTPSEPVHRKQHNDLDTLGPSIQKHLGQRQRKEISYSSSSRSARRDSHNPVSLPSFKFQETRAIPGVEIEIGIEIRNL